MLSPFIENTPLPRFSLFLLLNLSFTLATSLRFVYDFLDDLAESLECLECFEAGEFSANAIGVGSFGVGSSPTVIAGVELPSFIKGKVDTS